MCCPVGWQAKVITHSTMPTWVRPPLELLENLLTQNLFPFTSLSILLYSEIPLSSVKILSLVLAWKQDTFVFICFAGVVGGPGVPLDRVFPQECPEWGTWDHLSISFSWWPRT